MNWYVGQKVVCVIPIAPWLEKGATYTLTWIGHVCGCGLALSVGIAGRTGATKCTCCGKVRNGDDIVFDARRFRPLDSLTEQMDRIESEGAPVEQPEPQHA